ncbi:MAG TPA: hypothetical protein VIF38_03260 [Burkholderiales bacterium]
MGAAIKQIAIFAAVVIAIAAWAMRAPPRATDAPSTLSTQALRADYARQVRDNAPLRVQLQKKYPDVYRDLASQTRRDLGGCVVTEMMPGILRANCQ